MKGYEERLKVFGWRMRRGGVKIPKFSRHCESPFKWFFLSKSKNFRMRDLINNSPVHSFFLNFRIPTFTNPNLIEDFDWIRCQNAKTGPTSMIKVKHKFIGQKCS